MADKVSFLGLAAKKAQTQLYYSLTPCLLFYAPILLPQFECMLSCWILSPFFFLLRFWFLAKGQGTEFIEHTLFSFSKFLLMLIFVSWFYVWRSPGANTKPSCAIHCSRKANGTRAETQTFSFWSKGAVNSSGRWAQAQASPPRDKQGHPRNVHHWSRWATTARDLCSDKWSCELFQPYQFMTLSWLLHCSLPQFLLP